MRLIAFLLLTLAAYGQSYDKTTSADLTDVSNPNRIVKFSGKAQWRETRKDDYVTLCPRVTISLENISGKNIVAFVSIFKLLAFRGPEDEIRYAHDFFFKPKEWAAGEVDKMELPESIHGPYHITSQPEQPSYLKAQLLFVQFDDGTTWGDQTVGDTLISQRAEVEEFTSKLLSIYSTQGEAGVVAELEADHKGHGSVASVARTLNELRVTSGIQAVIERIKERSAVASHRRSTGKF